MKTIKQNTNAWLNERYTHIGASEVFGIVRYYATDDELLNVGWQPSEVREELPYATPWALAQRLYGNPIESGIDESSAEFGLMAERFISESFCGVPVPKAPCFVYQREMVSPDYIVEYKDIVALDSIGFIGKANIIIIETKTSRKKLDRPLYKWIAQVTTALSHGLGDKGVIVSLSGSCVMKEYWRGKYVGSNIRTKRKMIETAIKKGDAVIQNFIVEKNPALEKLIEICMDRFFYDVSIHKAIRPVLADGDSAKLAAQELLLNKQTMIVPKSIEIIEKYIAANEAAKKADAELVAAKQAILDFSISHNAAILVKGNISCKWSAAGSLLIKE